MNWFDLLPAHVAKRQIAWERRRTFYRMHEVGFTYAQIGERMGVSTVRAQQLGAYWKYWNDRPGRQGSPALAWIGAGFEFKAPLVGSGAVTAAKLAEAIS